MAASITDAGVLVDSLASNRAELDADFRAEFGSGPNGIDLSPQSYTGRQNAILAGRDVALQQLLAEVAGLLNLNNAQSRYLDFIGTLLSERRLAAAPATIPAVIYGVPGFDAGDRRVRYLRNSTVWRVPAGATIGANGTLAVTLTADIAGTATVDGTRLEAFQDGTDQWSIVDTSPSFVAVESTADSTPGRPVEGPTSYRARLRVAGRGSGTSTAPGVLRALQRVAGASAGIDNNRTLVPNANGVGPKSIEALVEEGSDEAVAQAILDSYSDTAGFFGSTVATAYLRNADGELDLTQPVEVRFTRIARISVVWVVTLATAGAETPLPDNAVSVIQAALVSYTNDSLTRGIDVLPEDGAAAIRSALPKGSVPAGGLTVLLGLKGGPPPAAAPVVITSRQRARTSAEPEAATVVGTNAQPFNVIAGQQLVLSVDGGSPQAVVFQVADFQFISTATALELATAINNRTNGIVAGTEQGALVIRSATTGNASSINIGATSSAPLLAVLGLTFGTTNGTDGDIAVTIT